MVEVMGMTGDPVSGPGTRIELIHLLRKVTVEFGLRQAEFAARNGMHPTDVRALICLLDAERAGTDATMRPAWGAARTAFRGDYGGRRPAGAAGVCEAHA